MSRVPGGVGGRSPLTKTVTLREGARLVLITLHRREGWDSPGPGAGTVGGGGRSPTVMDGVMTAIRDAARAHPGVDFVYPVHLNPNVRGPAHEILGSVSNVQLVEPIAYIPFVQLLARSTVIVTDSGGIQEEAPSLAVPVLVLRRTTERPEGLGANNRLIGTDPERIRLELDRVLAGAPTIRPELPAPSPFGDGRASARIQQAILSFFGQAEPPEEFGDPSELARLRAKPATVLE